MTHVIVRYKVKPEHAAQNEELVRAVYAELHDEKPAGFRYATFRLDDGVSFVHVASIDTDDGSNPLTSTPAFATFVQGIADRCSEPPIAVDANKIGSYGIGTPVARS
jgi:hypothetical protein